jgi:uncharacterized protein (TIGR02611 family)
MRADDTQEMLKTRTQQLPRTIARHQTRRLAVAIAGIMLLGIGAVLLIVPGPGLLVVALGLTVLSWEFRWAKRLLIPVRRTVKRIKVRRRSPR